ncbi:MAG: hypothetical protein EBS39_06755 [Gammaproteobacteria bacterium]|nr:hypothetical protein [Gammaproteobacteria bacterium]
MRTLPARELRAGLAEVIKYGLICDHEFFEWLEANAAALLALEPAALAHAVRRSCEIKAEIVARDEHERGDRALLNLGHTFGHAIETVTGYETWLHGEAIGAGLDLACMCDMRIASESATFAESFVRVGIVPGDGGAWLLPRAVGAAKAAEMAFTGDPISAAEALACGLISRVVPADSLLEEARALAGRIARNPSGILRMTKRLLREAVHNTLDSVLETSAAYQSLAHMSADHHEAVRAFIEKRPPKFS